MALYQNAGYLAQSSDAAFSKEFTPGSQPDHSGIYRCIGCGSEVVAEQERRLPPQNHHQHNGNQGSIRWRMIVYADHHAK